MRGEGHIKKYTDSNNEIYDKRVSIRLATIINKLIQTKNGNANGTDNENEDEADIDMMY